MITTILADDHEVFRQGLASLITMHGIDVVGTTGDRDQLFQLIQEKRPHVAVIDISMPGISIAELLLTSKQSQIPTQVLVLTASPDPQMAEELLKAGALGYMLKDNAFDEILIAIQCVAGGRKFVSSQLTGPLLLRKDEPTANSPWTARQLAILRMVAAGESSKQIASKLGIHVKTVDNHRQRIREKLSAKCAAEMIRIAQNRGLI